MTVEVDNRYPEVAAPYEKVRGVKKHGGVGGSRAASFSALKSIFMTLAAAVAVTVAVLSALPEPEKKPDEPVPVVEPFEAPELSIRSAELTAETVTPLIYTYQIALHSAESLQVSAVITDQNGGKLGTDGPYEHREDGTSPVRSAPLSWTEYPETVTLTLTGTYTEKGETKTLTASQMLAVPGKSFTAPTLSIRSAELTADTVTPLIYSYQVELNSAESLQVSAVITDENGKELGADGPFGHSADEASPLHSAALSWTEYPEQITLTLTGTYTEKDETKTLTASQTLSVPEQPFTAPVLTIRSAELTAASVTPLIYIYQVELNSAESLRVDAVITDENGTQLGADGPFDHSADETSPSHSAALSWTDRPVSLTLTLTGTYTEKGETKTLTATQTLSVPELPFTAPALTILSAELAADSVTPLTYTYQVELNSAETLRVNAVITNEYGVQLGADGPYDHDADGSSPARSAALRWTARPSSVTLTLIGTYTEKGSTKTLTASRTLTVPEPQFTAPTLSIRSAELTADTVSPLTYTYEIALNSADSLHVSAVITDEDGTWLGTDGPYDHTAAGSSPLRSVPLSWTEYPASVTLTLTGTYAEKGETKTLTASRMLSVPQPEQPFTAPTLSIVSAELTADTVTPLNYTYQIELNSADSLQVTAVITDENGTQAGTDGPYNHTSDGTSPMRSVALSWTDYPSSLTLTLTGTYTEDDETKTLTASQTLSVPEQPFTAPTLSIVSAELTADTVTPLNYIYQIELNSAESLQVGAVITDENGTQVGADGPYDHAADGTSPSRSALLSWTDYPSTLTLTLTGTYTEKGETRTLTASQTLSVPEQPFTAPTLSIVSAELTADTVTPLNYAYQIELNSADSLQVSAVITDENGTQLGTDGPYDHTADGTSPSRSAALSWTDYPTTLTLTLTGIYTEKGETRTLTASQTLSVPEQPFTAPTLSIVSAELTADTVTPLNYTCQIELNSAESLQVSAVITDENGTQLGTDGPYDHTSDGTSPARSAAFSWTDYPTTVTLTLTGTYTEKSETKTLTATRTLSVPEQPFTVPTLSIVSAELTADTVTPLLYTYQLALNSADSLQVSAVITDENGTQLGSDGPYDHTSDGTSPSRSAVLGWTDYPATLTLTLTGTYTEKGETKTLTATRTLSVPEQPFTAPTLSIQSAELTEDTVTPLLYTYQLALNSAESLQVTAVITDENNTELGTDGPYDHTADGTSPARSAAFSWTDRPSAVTLTLTGTYTEKGETKTLTATQTLSVPEPPFIAPALSILSAAFTSDTVTPLAYQYHVTLNSAASLQVTAVLTNESGAELGSDGAYTHSGDEDSPVRSLAFTWDDYPTAMTLTLTGTYTEKGETKTVTASQALPVPEKPFTAPHFEDVEAVLNDFEEWADVKLTSSYKMDIGDAASVSVTVTVVTDLDEEAGSEAPVAFTETDFHTADLQLFMSESSTKLTVTYTGVYEDKDGAEQTITETRTVIITMAPDFCGCGGEFGPSAYDDTLLELDFWAEFMPRTGDPHANDYEFEALEFNVSWYDSDGDLIRTEEAAPVSMLVYTKHEDDGYYSFEFLGVLPAEIPAGAVTAVLHLTIKDTTTGKVYSMDSYEMDL